jgi:plasmid stabilization system protein ParE
MTVKLDQFAVQELFEATEYYSSQSRTAAEKFIEDFEHAVNLIQDYPEAFSDIGKGFRRCLFKKFNYSIIYKVDIDAVVVTAVMNNFRKPEYWYGRK